MLVEQSTYDQRFISFTALGTSNPSQSAIIEKMIKRLNTNNTSLQIWMTGKGQSTIMLPFKEWGHGSSLGTHHVSSKVQKRYLSTFHYTLHI
jgi:hypothetical protein